MAEYTVATLAAVLVVVAIEVFWARTGIFRSLQYWLAMVIIFFFQILVDGWLTRLDDPVVRYTPGMFLGIRFPLSIPIEDFGFGFALVTAVIITWKALGRREVRE